jgi:putative phage-type endonuclease
MKIIDILQGSEVWKKLRFSKITGTDSAILTGSNIWKTKLELWEQKLGLKEPDKENAKMKRGSDLEEPARLILNKLVGIEFKPVVAISDKYPHLMASLDGLSPCARYICEIKCPSMRTHEDAINGIIAPYYMDQMQHCLLVTGCDICYYFSYNPEHLTNPYAIEAIYPDLQKQSLIIEKGFEFYKQMCNFEPPVEWVFERNK